MVIKRNVLSFFFKMATVNAYRGEIRRVEIVFYLKDLPKKSECKEDRATACLFPG